MIGLMLICLKKCTNPLKKFDSDYVFCNSMIEEDLTGKSTPKSMKTKIKKITGYTLSEDKCFNISDMQKGQLRIFACVNGFVFKKEFILSNDLKFPKGNLAEDTVFIMMHLCVLKKLAGVTMHFITTDSV